jgi:hypothetical protein
VQVRWQTVSLLLQDGVVYYSPSAAPALLPALVSAQQQQLAQAQQAGRLAPPSPAELVILQALLRLVRALRHSQDALVQLHADYSLVHVLFALLSAPHLPSMYAPPPLVLVCHPAPTSYLLFPSFSL